jgi:hypothetical protein
MPPAAVIFHASIPIYLDTAVVDEFEGITRADIHTCAAVKTVVVDLQRYNP